MDKITVFFGAGEKGRLAIGHAKSNQIDIDCIIDADPVTWGAEYHGIEVYRPEHLLDFGENVEVIITTYPAFARYILMQLADIGFVHMENVLICAEKIGVGKFLEERFSTSQSIDKGGTGNRKYEVTTADKRRLFLHVVDITQYKRTETVFMIMRQATALGIPIPYPEEFGKISKWGGYLLLSWIEGEDLIDTLPNLTQKEQYALGLKAGGILRKIHSIPAPDVPDEWTIRSYEKAENIKHYHKESLYFTEVERKLVDHIAENIHLLSKRSECFLQGDYHLGNMMLQNGKIIIVDFDGFRYGVPWSDFSRITWSAQKSPCFATGQIHGYFNGKPPAEAWPLIAFYAALDAINFFLNVATINASDMVRKRLMINAEILGQFDDMRSSVPVWYFPPEQFTSLFI